MQFEFARAVREGVKNLLWEHVLPRLLAEGAADRGLWTHFASAAIDFERQLAPARGVAVGVFSDDSSDALLPPLVLADGCLTVVYGVRFWDLRKLTTAQLDVILTFVHVS